MDEKNFEIGSGNVFSDIDASNPEERLAKAKLATQINLLIQEKNITQKDAAELLGVDQPKISALHKGRLAGFSLERLFRFLYILGQDISIQITPKMRTKKKPNIDVIFQKTKTKPTRIKSTATRTALIARKKK